TFQFSELAKITMVFFLAGILREDNSFGNVVKATVIAAVHVLILVASTDLGTAFVFFMAYVVIIYVATRKARYPLLGLSGMCLACIAAYFMFSHVRNRVALWRDPIGSWDISSQLAQGLFGMCSGGWFGTGLYEGRPDLIPVAVKDFIFSAICEELGIIFGICLILLCMSTFLLIINISMKMSKRFYKLIAMGLGTEYATQVFLTVGGTIKFIPMTGITLPLVSYGGSSMLSTIVMLSIIQGLYILREDEGEALEKRNRQSKRKKQKKQNPKRTEQKDVKQRKPKAEDDLERRIEEQTEKSLHW
ncbi:MAG: FtsW/RodA/SpoVE family cell cycle protein, partial [Lachnospiraceae bacterium]|nr:FtsW/RodA/SpoVE family cell cycle protein [Lachnospiraceae bacterium]